MITYNQLKKNEEIRTYITMADRSLAALGYTEHSFAHVGRVAETAGFLLDITGHSVHEVELVKIAGFLHDIGNVVNRVDHSQSGAVMAFQLLRGMDIAPMDLATIVTAIGNHDEGTGVPVDDLSAALIIADKSDVRRSRVRNQDPASFDIHDRVNYSVERSELKLNEEKTSVRLELQIDTQYCSIMDYFEIFLGRMTLCRRAAEKLGLRFRLVINGQILL